MGDGMISRLFLLLQLLQCVFSFVNLSFNKTADMSSSQYSDKWLADKAVDGDVSQKVTQGSCAVTSDNFHKHAWWRVDLGEVYVLNSVKIYYRKESDDPKESLTYRLSGFSIYVADTLNWWIGTRCYLHNNGNHTNPGPSDILTVPCNATGRYVNVYKQRNGSCIWNPNPFYKIFCTKIELCEVQVLKCENGTFGLNCSYQCGNCNADACNHIDGTCPNGCAPGWKGILCNETCPVGRYGINCSYNCSENCINTLACSRDNGYCLGGCSEGWKGHNCDQQCERGNYGRNCQATCFNCQNYTCNITNGACQSQCIDGHSGTFCNIHQQTSGEDKSDIMIVITVTFGVIIIVLSVALVIMCLQRRNQSPLNVTNSTRSNTTHEEQGSVQLSDMNLNQNNNERCPESVTKASSRVTYEDLNMPTPTESNTYESLQPGREVTYTNTVLL